jgi:hypothetical protein
MAEPHRIPVVLAHAGKTSKRAGSLVSVAPVKTGA